MPPPQLARDAPVLDVVHPVIVGAAPVVRHEANLTVIDDFQADIRDRLSREQSVAMIALAHGDEPLIGEHRLDDHVGPSRTRHHELVRLFADQQTRRGQFLEDPFACIKAVQAAKTRRGGVRDRGFSGEDADRFQAMALADFPVVEVMGRCDLHAAGAECRIHIVVSDDRDGAGLPCAIVRQRQADPPPDQLCVAWVVRVHCNCGVAQHRFRTSGCDHQRLDEQGASGFGVGGSQLDGDRVADQWIANLPDPALFFLAVDLQVRDRRLQRGVPVDQPFASVDQALLVQLHEDLEHGGAHGRVHGEVSGARAVHIGIVPVARCPESAHLADDRGA